MLLTFAVSFSSVKSLWKHPYGHAQSVASWVTEHSHDDDRELPQEGTSEIQVCLVRPWRHYSCSRAIDELG